MPTDIFNFPRWEGGVIPHISPIPNYTFTITPHTVNTPQIPTIGQVYHPINTFITQSPRTWAVERSVWQDYGTFSIGNPTELERKLPDLMLYDYKEYPEDVFSLGDLDRWKL